MSRPKLLELGGCEGASTAGWQRAGWDVTTVDLDANRLKYNPAETKIHNDALRVLASVARGGKFWAWGPFDAVSLHPPCQWYTRGRAKDRGNATKWVAGAYGGARRDKHEAKFIRKGGYVPADKETVKALLGVTHNMTWQGLFEAVPVPYTEYVGRALMAQVESVAA